MKAVEPARCSASASTVRRRSSACGTHPGRHQDRRRPDGGSTSNRAAARRRARVPRESPRRSSPTDRGPSAQDGAVLGDDDPRPSTVIGSTDTWWTLRRPCHGRGGRVPVRRRGRERLADPPRQTDWTADRRHTGRTDLPLQRGRTAGPPTCPVLGLVPRPCRGGGVHQPVAASPPDLCLGGHGRPSERRRRARRVGLRRVRRAAARPTCVRPIPEWSIWTTTIRDGESLGDVARRTGRVLWLDALDEDGDAVRPRPLPAHLAAMVRFPGDRRQPRLLPASISVLGFEREVPVIEQWNLNTDSPPGYRSRLRWYGQ